MSGNTQLGWQKADIGDQLITKFILNETGKYSITAHLTKGPDYGKVQISLNGKTIVKSINCYNENGVIAVPINIGTYTLSEGENIFSIKIIGADKSAKPGNKAGVDYLKFEKIN